MEEAKGTTQTMAPQPPQSTTTKKRPLDISHLQNHPYYKMRAVIKHLRPHFIQKDRAGRSRVLASCPCTRKVLKTPDFRNCEAATEIREKIKVAMDLYKEITAETINQEDRKNVPLSGGIQDGQKPKEHQQDVKLFSGNISEKQQTEEVRVQGTYIVGGSAFGWNFITFPGDKTVYYGRTKEAYRSVNPKSQQQ